MADTKNRERSQASAIHSNVSSRIFNRSNNSIGINPPPDSTHGTYALRLTPESPGPGGGIFAYGLPNPNIRDSINQIYKFGEVISGRIDYWKNMPAFGLNMDILTIHEITSILAGIFRRANSIPSVWNYGPPPENKDFTQSDKYWMLYTFSRMPGNRSPDTDYYLLDANTGHWLNPVNGQVVEP